MHVKKLVAALLTTLVTGTTAQAVTYEFSYVSGTDTLTGLVEGELLGNQDTLLISSFTDVVYNGVSYGALGFVTGTRWLTDGRVRNAYMSLSGDRLDFVACDTPACTTYLAMGTRNTTLSRLVGGDATLSSFGVNEFMTTTTSFAAAEWTPETNLTLPSIPLPSSLPLLGAAIGAIFMIGRYRRSPAATA